LPAGWGRPLLALIAVVVAIVAGVLLATQKTPPNQRSAATTKTSHALESMFEDDQLLIYQPMTPAGTGTVRRTLATLRALGVDRLRLMVDWYYIAPDPGSTTAPPNFRAADPAAYPAANWLPYDRIVRLAAAAGIAVDFDLSGPGPLWAMTSGAPDPKTATHYLPVDADFKEFVAAVGRRYNGSYPAPQPLPRVSFWSIWNEPNQPGWLAPQWATAGGQTVPLAARLYRNLVDAAFAGLAATGHTPGRDTILFGELAPEGCVSGSPCVYPRTEWPIPPIPYLQALYCLGPDYRPLRSTAASLLGCPSAGSPGAFIKSHPGLFDATGFAHHPYAFYLAPNVSMPNPSFAPLADLRRLEHALDRALGAYGVSRRLPIYLTEYGYETSPPRTVPPLTSLAKQSLYLDEAAYLAWQDPRVHALAQFQLRDSAPDTSYPPGSRRYWSTFQTGLEFLNGAPKPSIYSYRLPIFLPRTSAPAHTAVPVWAMLRAAPNGTRQTAQIQWRPPHGAYRTIKTLSTANPTGILTGEVELPGSGAVRIAWKAPSGPPIHSRAVGVTVTG
jgi:hypothetical protein